MADPTIAPARRFKTGRVRPRAHGMRLRLGHYLKADAIALPASCDYAAKATGLDRAYLNDELGDCTTAGAFHIAGVLLGNAGVPTIFSNAQIRDFYSATTGYVPGRPETDQGGDEETVLNYWRAHGLEKGLHAIAGHVAVDATKPLEVLTALYLFENLYFGVEMPDAWVNPEPQASGFVWDVAGAPVQDNGHCYIGCGFDAAHRVRIATWGMTGWMTMAAIARYATRSAGGELYAVLGKDSIAKATAKAPNGLAWTKLVEHFDAMGGKVAA